MNPKFKALFSTIVVFSACVCANAQAPATPPAGASPQPPRRAALSVTTTAWPDGGEVPMRNAARGDNKSPAFEFHWTMGVNPTDPPATLQTYAIIFHDLDIGNNKGPVDTFHWSVFNIPGTAKSIPEGLGEGDLPDGTRNGPGLGSRNGHAPVYFGPGAGPGPFHHYVFEFYALDTKLDLPANTTRDEILKAMDGHVVGKAAYVGRFHTQP